MSRLKKYRYMAIMACCFKNILNNNIFFNKDKNCCDLLFKTTNYRASIQQQTVTNQ